MDGKKEEGSHSSQPDVWARVRGWDRKHAMESLAWSATTHNISFFCLSRSLSHTHIYEHIFTHRTARTSCAGSQYSLSEAVASLVTLAWWVLLWDLLSNESLWSWSPPSTAVEGCRTCTQAVVKDRRSSEAGNAYVFSTVRIVSENVQRQSLSNVVLSRDKTIEHTIKVVGTALTCFKIYTACFDLTTEWKLDEKAIK